MNMIVHRSSKIDTITHYEKPCNEAISSGYIEFITRPAAAICRFFLLPKYRVAYLLTKGRQKVKKFNILTFCR